MSRVVWGVQLYAEPKFSFSFKRAALVSGATNSTLAPPNTPMWLNVTANGAVVSAEIVNYTTTGTRRVEINIAASYDSPIDTVLEALLEAAKLPTALETPAPSAAVKSYGDSAINYVLFVWCNSADFWTTQCECNRRLKAVFEEKGVAMTYPHINIHVEK